MKTYIEVKTSIEGFHNYPDAPEIVSFLSNRHRHIFVVIVRLLVKHDNREKEIFIEKKRIEDLLEKKFGYPCEFGEMSCEMIAKYVLKNTSGAVSCKVLEDGEGGAVVYV